MAFVSGTILKDSNGKILKDLVGEIMVGLPNTDPQYLPDILPSSVEQSVRSYVTPFIYKIVQLYPDETICNDLSPYIKEDSISYSQSFQNGQTCSLSFDIIDVDKKFYPNPVGGIWYGDKMQFFAGLLVDDSVVFYSKGIFVVKDLSYQDGSLHIQFADKFGMLDGTISGATESKYKITPNTPIKTAITSLLALDSGDGLPFDKKRINYPSQYDDAIVPYTITKDYQSNIGDIITDLANIISCTVFYDEYGCLTFEPFNELVDISKKPIQWRYVDSEMQFNNSDITLDFSKVYNKVMVVGSNINGYLCKYIATNNNAASPTSIGKTPIRFLYIADSNIYSDALCKVRAEYELQTQSMLAVPVSFSSIYIPFMRVNDLITYTNSDILYEATQRKVFSNEKLLVTSVSLAGNGSCNISAKNVRELPFYG